MISARLSSCVLLLLVSAACDARAVKNDNDVPTAVMAALRDGTDYELLSLDPDRTKEPPADNLHGWRVLGRTKIEDAATRKKLNDALQAGAKENDGTVAGCFNPRHGISVKHNGKTFDLVICFECMSVAVYEQGKRHEGFLVTRTPQKVFDAVMTAAKVPLPGGNGTD